MQIVININDKVYGLLRYFEESLGLNDKKDDSDDVKTALMRAVINGTPLPKGHGRLIDADALIAHVRNLQKSINGYSGTYDQNMIINMINNASSVIDANKE